MEAIAIPLSFIVLVWVFGGLTGRGAATGRRRVRDPRLDGRAAAITFVTDVSIFALNLTIANGSGARHRLHAAHHQPVPRRAGRRRRPGRALVRTMATAGRTVLFSALTVALSMVAMVLFPMYFLKSFAYAGIAVVAFAAVAAIVVAPAAIVLLGDRLDALDTRRLFRWLLSRPEPDAQAGRADVLVPLARNSLCAGRFPSASRSSPCFSARRAVPRDQVGLPGRPRAAAIRVGARGR